jgi:hypothetical protein
MENTDTKNVDVIASAMSHVPAPSLIAGVVNADQRPRRTWGEVCPLAPAAELQGTTLPSSTPVIGGVQVSGIRVTGAQVTGAQVTGARLMGKGFDKYRTGSHARRAGG